MNPLGEPEDLGLPRLDVHDHVVVMHHDGIPWDQAKIPPRWHRCRRQTWGVVNYFTVIDRCRCGAVRHHDARHGAGPWRDKNRRRDRGRR